MSELTRLDGFDDLHVREHPQSWCSKVLLADGHLLGCQRAILKFEPGSICEVLGYQLATALGMRVPRMQGVWTPFAGSFGTGYKYKACRVGILIEELVNRECLICISGIEEEQLDRIGRDIVARTLALCAFAGNEWGQFVPTEEGCIYFIDLEDVLGALVPPEDLMTLGPSGRELAPERLKEAHDRWESWHRPSIKAVFREADRLRISELVRGHLCQLYNLPRSDRAKLVSVAGHPLAQEISEFAAALMESRVSAIGEILAFPKAIHE